MGRDSRPEFVTVDAPAPVSVKPARPFAKASALRPFCFDASPHVIHRPLSSDLQHNKTVEGGIWLLGHPVSSNYPYNPPNVPTVGPMDYRLDGLFPSRSAAPITEVPFCFETFHTRLLCETFHSRLLCETFHSRLLSRWAALFSTHDSTFLTHRFGMVAQMSAFTRSLVSISGVLLAQTQSEIPGIKFRQMLTCALAWHQHTL
jgi:hypothetical protein